MGRVIGNYLGRWGSRIEPTPSPDEAALLFALNRLEILPYVIQAIDEGKIVICNRGPYANIFSIARQVLKEGVNWENLSPKQKKERLGHALFYDRHFLSEIQKRTEIANIFLKLNHEDSMALAAKKAERDLGAPPDLHEENISLQELAAHIYNDVAIGAVEDHQAYSIETIKTGRIGTWLKKRQEDSEFFGIRQTIEKVILKAAQIFNWPDFEQTAYFLNFKDDFNWHAFQIVRAGWGQGVDFEFRQVFKLGDNLQPDIWQMYPELRGGLESSHPNLFRTIEASRLLDQAHGPNPEKR